MEKSGKRHVLLCVAGGTPQIITETLWALKERGQRVDEVRVITTTEGRDKVRRLLLDPSSGKFHQFLRDFPDAGDIKFNDRECLYLLTKKGRGVPSERDLEEDRLADILTDEDNEGAANQICEIVRDLTHDPRIHLHASAAGGRRTMSIYLTAAMQLFGRHDDVLSHVLVSKEVEFNPQFFYKPPRPEVLRGKDGEPLRTEDGREYTTADAEIYLARIPFICLRGIGLRQLGESVESYDALVTRVRADLKLLESAYDLRLDLRRNTVTVANRAAELSLREFFVIALFAHFRQRGLGEGGFTALNRINREHLDAACRLLSRARGRERGFEEFGLLPGAGFVYKLDVECVRNKAGEESAGERLSVAEAREKVVKTFREVLGKITPKLTAARIPEEFDVQRHGRKESYAFGMEIAPERIRFE